MKILSLVKAVPATAGGVESAERRASEFIANPADITALEEALSLRDLMGGSVIVMTMGSEACENVLRQCLARGADEAVMLTDRIFSGADTAATSRTIAEAVKYIGGFDLIFCGRKTTDGETGQVGPELATRLGLPFAANCTGLEYQDGKLTCSCLNVWGSEKVRLSVPAVVSFAYGINSPRLASLVGLYRANRAKIERLDSKKLNIAPENCGQAGSPTEVIRSFKCPFEKRSAVFLNENELEKAFSFIRGKMEEESCT
ncbi:MAG: electron transfer flavoprotein subunit beta/FixA family protein [Pyramidobacter sp.]|nr:electron transfer flavoprotein subunit beta/FixA family protein [Pyramidobacter sp.]